MLHRLLAILALATTLAAQTPTYPHLVLTRLPGTNPAAAIVEADTSTGAVAPLGRFASDTLPPLAIGLDPFDRHLLVALDLGTGSSRIVRLERTAAGVLEFSMCDVPGRVTALWVFDDLLMIASDGPGVLRAPRRGGPATLAFPVANLTAMHGYGVNGPPLTLGWTGRPGTANPTSGVALVDFQTGQPYLGPYNFSTPANVELTGAIDLPTGVPRQLLSFADGSFWLFAGVIGPPTQILTSVMIPAGGAVAMAPSSAFGMPLALGGAPFPHLYEVDFWTGAVTLRSAALPGDPVDFCWGGDRSASGNRFAPSCGPQVLNQSWTGSQSPGAALTVQAASPLSQSPFLLLCIGLTDFPGLPVLLPGGCQLHVAGDAVLLRPLVNFTASHSLSIPNQQAFLGVMLFTQWFDLGPLGISASDAIAHHIGL